MGMPIDEVIQRYKNNAEYERTHGNLQGCLEFRQLAEWLEQYQKFKADYETRLKADMVAMLTEIQLEIEELDTANNNWSYMNCSDIIQQKINELKENTDGSNN